jgi:type VI secretion system secreted protein Hcp
MSGPVYLQLRVNGAVVEGESLETSLGRQNAIECLYYRQGVATPRAAGSGMATGRRTYEPLVIRKRVDKSSPLLARALTQNQVVDGVFKFFRSNPAGDGTTQHYYTTEISQGRIVAITQFVGDGAGPGELANPPLEEVALVFNQITWTSEIGGLTHTDSWTASDGHASSAGGASTGGAPTGSAAAAPPAGGSAPSDAGLATPVAAPEPLRRSAAERRPPSRVAATVPLSAAELPGVV